MPIETDFSIERACSTWHDHMRPHYLDDSYLCTFEAIVERAEEGRVLLDNTAFYPQSGGQPSDTGYLVVDGIERRVTGAEMSGGMIWHLADGVAAGDRVMGRIDWERRLRFMRSHTACHILSAVIFRETGARITGNQIDLERSRVDFSLEQFDRSKIGDYLAKANGVISEDIAVSISYLTHEEAMAVPGLVKLAMEVPDREEVRVVEIEGVDRQACGGTHVRRTGEVGGIELVKAENKGKANRRIYFRLVDGD